MVERQMEIYGRVYQKTAADGSYASISNLEQAKSEGIQDVAFHKKCHLSIEDMVKSNWVYRQLKNFRAGIEGNISCMKRVYGLAPCSWKGLPHFKAYVWSGIVAYNLALFTRLQEDAG